METSQVSATAALLNPSGTDLGWLLAERTGVQLSSASLSALFTKQPAQVQLSMLIALCTALECTPNDLYEIDTTPAARPMAPTVPMVGCSSAARKAWSSVANLARAGLS
jgi:putative transcriptional regulator